MNSESKGRLARWAQRKAAIKRSRGTAAPKFPGEPTGVPATRAEPPDTAQIAAQETSQPDSEPAKGSEPGKGRPTLKVVK